MDFESFPIRRIPCSSVGWGLNQYPQQRGVATSRSDSDGELRRFTLKEYWQRRNQPKDEDDVELQLVRSVVGHEMRSIERICFRVRYMSEHGGNVLPFHRCFIKQGHHEGLLTLARTLVYETNRKVRDCGIDRESTGMVSCIVAAEYMARISRRIPSEFLQTFFLAAFMLALKVVEDDTLPNSFFASLAGFPLQEVNDMEAEFCTMLNWNLAIPVTTYRFYKETLLQC